MSLTLALLAGLAIAAASGLRAFLPLLAVGLASRFGGLPLPHAAAWLAGDLTLIALAAATAIEIVGDKIPMVDHALDAIATVVRPAAAALASYGVLSTWPTPWAQILAILLGGTALAIHAVKAKTRLGSSVLSFGLANPWLSILEDGLALMFVAVAFLAPAIMLALIVLVIVAVRRALRRRSLPARA